MTPNVPNKRTLQYLASSLYFKYVHWTGWFVFVTFFSFFSPKKKHEIQVTRIKGFYNGKTHPFGQKNSKRCVFLLISALWNHHLQMQDDQIISQIPLFVQCSRCLTFCFSFSSSSWTFSLSASFSSNASSSSSSLKTSFFYASCLFSEMVLLAYKGGWQWPLFPLLFCWLDSLAGKESTSETMYILVCNELMGCSPFDIFINPKCVSPCFHQWLRVSYHHCGMLIAF